MTAPAIDPRGPRFAAWITSALLLIATVLGLVSAGEVRTVATFGWPANPGGALLVSRLGEPAFLLTLIIGGLAMHWLPPRAVESLTLKLKPAPSITMGVLIGLAILLIEAARPDGVAPFIYFQF